MKKMILSALLGCLILVTGFAAPVSAKDGAVKKLVLFDFEDDKEVKEIYKENGPGTATKEYPVERSSENATSGKSSLKVTFPNEGDWAGLHFVKFAKDWSAYDLLKFDVFNPTADVLVINASGADKDAGFTEESYFGQYNLRFNFSTPLRPGKNTIEVDLSGMTVESGERLINFKEMKRFAIFPANRPKDLVLYIDNIRLEKAQ